jgi:hypothetical protein
MPGDSVMKVRRAVAVIAAVVGVVLVAIAVTLLPRLWSMRSEYETAGVIRRVEEYVTKSHGRWPRSWADLGEDLSHYTKVNFSLDPITATRSEVASAITPVSGRYLTYPHSQRDLERLYATMHRYGEQVAPDEASSSR